MCCHVSNKTAHTEEVQVRAESMEPENNATKAKDDDDVSATSDPVKAVEKKDGSPSYSPSPPKSQDAEEILEQPQEDIVVDPPQKSPTKAVENRGGFDWYKLTDKDKDRFIDCQGKSSCIEPNPNLIMLAM